MAKARLGGDNTGAAKRQTTVSQSKGSRKRGTICRTRRINGTIVRHIAQIRQYGGLSLTRRASPADVVVRAEPHDPNNLWRFWVANSIAA